MVLFIAASAAAGGAGSGHSLTETTITLANVHAETGQTVTTTVSIETLAVGDSVNSFSLTLSIDGAATTGANSPTIEASWIGLPLEPTDDGAPGVRFAAAGFRTGVGCERGPCELFKVTWQLPNASTIAIRLEGILAGQNGATGAIEVPFKVVGGTTMGGAAGAVAIDDGPLPAAGATETDRESISGREPNAFVPPAPLRTLDLGLAVFALFALGAVGWTLLRWHSLLRTSRALSETTTLTNLDPVVQRAIGSFLDFVEERGRLAQPPLIVSPPDGRPK